MIFENHYTQYTMEVSIEQLLLLVNLFRKQQF